MRRDDERRKVRDSTPYCVECGCFKTEDDGPWLRHPVDFGWWCGCKVGES